VLHPRPIIVAEERRKLPDPKTQQLATTGLIFSTFLICAAIIYDCSSGASYSFDQYWHLKTGQDFLYKGLSPYQDNYSYTFHGTHIKQQPYIFQFIYAVLERHLGFDEATKALRCYSGIALIILTYLFGREEKAPVSFVIMGLCSATFFLIDRFFPRPELFDYLLIVAGFFLARRLELKFSLYTLTLSAIFLLAWINFHAGIIGYAIFAYPFIQLLTNRKSRCNARASEPKIVVWGLIFVGLGFINLDIQHPILLSANFSTAWDSISEHRSSVELLDQKPLLLAFWTISLIVFSWSFLSRNYGLAFTALIFIFASIDRVRMINLSGMSTVCILIILSSNIRSTSNFPRIRQSILYVIGGTAAALSFALLIVGWGIAINQKSDGKLEERAPTEAINYLLENHKGGNILNYYNLGGYLIYSLPSTFQVFIDGRTGILYPPDFYTQYRTLTAPDDDFSLQLKDKWKPDFALWEFDSAPHYTLLTKLAMNVAFIDDNYLLYDRKSASLNRLATLLRYPMCFGVDDLPLIKSQISHSSQLSLNNKSIALLELISRNDIATIEKNISERLSTLGDLPASDRVIRLVAHSQFKLGHYGSAVEAWSSIANPKTRDAIYSAVAAIKAKRYEYARDALSLIISDEWQAHSPITLGQAIRVDTLISELNSLGIAVTATGVSNLQKAPAMLPGTNLIEIDQIIYRAHCSEYNNI